MPFIVEKKNGGSVLYAIARCEMKNKVWVLSDKKKPITWTEDRGKATRYRRKVAAQAIIGMVNLSPGDRLDTIAV